jgi:hypothetical protein
VEFGKLTLAKAKKRSLGGGSALDAAGRRVWFLSHGWITYFADRLQHSFRREDLVEPTVLEDHRFGILNSLESAIGEFAFREYFEGDSQFDV